MSLRANNGGGSRKAIFENTANKDEILNKAKSLFLLDEKCVFGNLNDMDINLGNFKKRQLMMETSPHWQTM